MAEHDPPTAWGSPRMNQPSYTTKTTHSTWYGRSFSVEARQFAGERAYVHLVSIDGWPPFPRPDDIADAATLEEALDNGFRFAVGQIND